MSSSGLPLLPCTTWGDATDYPGLSTVFTPPEICFTRFTVWTDITDTDDAITTAVQDNFDPSWLSCLPTEYDTSSCWHLTFSPALCPSGHAVTNTNTNDGVTTGTCCMSGFSVAASTNGYIKCRKSTTNFQVTRRGGADPWASTEYTSTMDSGDVEHRGWVVMWKSSQLADMTATTGSRTETRSGSITGAAAANTETDTGSSDDSSGDGGGKGLSLSGGAVAGIVVGVLAALALGVAAGILWGRRGKKTKDEDQKGTPIMQVYNEGETTRGAAYELGNEEPRHELSGP